jgi:hypothetical protein
MDWLCEAGYDEMAVSDEMMSDRGGWRHAAPTPNELGKGQEQEEEYKYLVHLLFPCIKQTKWHNLK